MKNFRVLSVAAILAMGLVQGSWAQAGFDDEDDALHAKKTCEKYGDGPKADASAQKLAVACDKLKTTPDKKADCYELPIDIVFHCSGNYPLILTFLEKQYSILDSTQDEARLISILSALSYYTYSVEVSDIQDKKITDFTMKPLTLFTKREARFKNSYAFYNNSLDSPVLIVSHHQFGSEKIKREYYRELKRLMGRLNALWPTQVEAKYKAKQISEDEYRALTLQRRAATKILERYREKFDN
jgi:hypothetical protein